jgi:chaperonin GroES
MALKPLADNLIVKPVEQEERTSGGIVLPDTAKEKPQQGKIIAVGPGRLDKDGKRIAIDAGLKPGVIVMFKKYSTTEAKDGDDDIYIIDENSILAIVE